MWTGCPENKNLRRGAPEDAELRLDFLIFEDDRARERMGAAARARVEKDYTAETITRKLESIWASLAN